MSIYDDIDADVLRNYQEYSLANIIYYSLKESTTSEQSARMTAMDNASKNACKCPAQSEGFPLLRLHGGPRSYQRVLAILEEEQESWGLVLGSATDPVRIEKLYSSP